MSPGPRLGASLPAAGLLLLAACAGSGDADGAPEAGADPGDASAVEARGEAAGTAGMARGPAGAECVQLGYPCTLGEVSPEAAERTLALVDSTLDRLERDGIDAALTWVEGRPGVVHASGDDAAIRFRVEGGRPAWVLGPAAFGDHTAGAARGTGGDPDRTGPESALGGPDAARSGPPRAGPGLVPGSPARPAADGSESALLALLASVALPTPLALEDPVRQDVVGKDTNGDGKVNNRDDKRALVLSPYRWQFGAKDEGAMIEAMLQNTRGYAGNVTFQADDEVTLDSFLHWSRYDVVHVSTHGTRHCYRDPKGRRTCRTLISTGIDFDYLDKNFSSVPGIAVLSGFEDRGAGQSRRFVRLGLNDDFFLFQYPDGLDRTLVIFSACETADQFPRVDLQRPDVVAALSAESFRYYGWTEAVPSSAADEASRFLYELLHRGVRSEHGHERLRERRLDRAVNSDGRVARFVGWGPGDLRVREVITLLDPESGDSLPERTRLAGILRGVPGDGRPDTLDLAARLDGIEDGRKGRLAVRFELDGRRFGPRIPLASPPEPVRVTRASEYVYRVDAPGVPLGFDLESGGEYSLEAVLALPGGGESRYETLVSGTGCWFRVSWGGARSGSLEGHLVGPPVLGYPLPQLWFQEPGALALNIDLEEGAALQPGQTGRLAIRPAMSGTGYMLFDIGATQPTGPAKWRNWQHDVWLDIREHEWEESFRGPRPKRIAGSFGGTVEHRGTPGSLDGAVPGQPSLGEITVDGEFEWVAPGCRD